MSARQRELFGEPSGSGELVEPDEPTSTIASGAVIVGPYRYHLHRVWSAEGGSVCWIMLNPSKADALADDPTTRRCIGFSRAWGFGSLVIVNLFGWRATDPSELASARDPVGPENDSYLILAAEAVDRVVCAWGVEGGLRSRDAAVLAALEHAGVQPHALGWTKDGYPRHPLYLPGDLQPQAWTRPARG